MIYTSYFSNWHNFPKGARLISISRSSPKYFSGEKYLKLAPDINLLKAYKARKVDEKTYTEMFEKYLETLDRDSVKDFLESNCTILLCYEKSNDFCHRHIVAKWLGEEVKEL